MNMGESFPKDREGIQTNTANSAERIIVTRIENMRCLLILLYSRLFQKNKAIAITEPVISYQVMNVKGRYVSTRRKSPLLKEGEKVQ